MILRNANTRLAHGLWLSSLNNMQISFLKQQDTTRSSIVKMKKVQVGKDQEKAQSERDSHSKNRGGKKPN